MVNLIDLNNPSTLFPLSGSGVSVYFGRVCRQGLAPTQRSEKYECSTSHAPLPPACMRLRLAPRPVQSRFLLSMPGECAIGSYP